MWSVPDVNHVSGTDRFGLATPARLALPILRVQTCDLRLRRAEKSAKTMSNNGLQRPGSGCEFLQWLAGFEWGLVWGSWHPQAFVGKTNILNALPKRGIS